MTKTSKSHADAVDGKGPGVREFEELTQIANELFTTQRQLHKQGAELRKLNDEKNLAVGIVAHDLRNPLALIQMQSEFLLGEQAGSLNDEQRDLLESICQQGQLMLSVVNDLLDVSAIDAGRFDLNLLNTDVGTLVERSVRRNSLLASQKPVNIRYRGPEQELYVELDAPKFEQVLNNLIGNAVKYSPLGSEVEVTLSAAEKAFELKVQDRGPGIPDDKLSSLFSPFATAGVRPSAGETCTGLGLAIAKKIVAKHKGSISVESKVGRGSCFAVRMPWRAGPPPASRGITLSRQNQPPGPQSAPRVLIVDDSIAATKMTARLLGTFSNAVVEIAHDGQSAIDMEIGFRPDVVLLDIELPVHSGVEVARRLLRRYGDDAPHLCVVTGHSGAYLDELTAGIAFDAILRKPIAIDDLREVMEKVQTR